MAATRAELTAPGGRSITMPCRAVGLGGLVAAAALALSGCAGPSQRPSPASEPPVAARPASQDAPAGRAAVPTEANAATVALLERSRSQRATGDLESAAATLERALSIEPNSAALWIELAEVRWNQGDRAQANSLARKALTLAGSDAAVVDRAERLLARR
jgi:Tfp pilus assembly protein PilF